MSLVKTSILSSSRSFITILCGFLVVKIIAITTGPSGLAYYSQFQTYILMVTAIFSAPLNTAIIKYTAQEAASPTSVSNLWIDAWKIGLLGVGIYAFLSVVFKDELAQLILKDKKYSSLFLFHSMIFIFVLGNVFSLAALNGLKKIKQFVAVNIFSSILILLFVGGFAYFWGIEGALFGLAVSSAFPFLISFTLLLKLKIIRKFSFKNNNSQSYTKRLLKFSTMTIVSSFLLQGSTLLVRDHVGEFLGWDSAGKWQGIRKLSDVYMNFFTTTIAVYYLPRLSEIKDDMLIRKEVFSTMKVLLPISFLGLCFVYFMRHYLIRIAFSEAFLDIAPLFFWQLVGDYLKIASWLLSYLMLAKAMVKLHIFSEVLFSFLWLFGSIYFANMFGIIGLTYVHALNYLIYLIFNLFIFRRLFSNAT